MRIVPIVLTPIVLAMTAMLPPIHATTLELLSMSEMIQKSTTIARAQVVGSRSAFRGRDIYTYYQLQVRESWKPAGAQRLEVAVPGGTAGGFRQTAPGAPSLKMGGEYVIFLWTSRSGLTQVIGLSQGLFSVIEDASGDPVLARPAAAATMLDPSGKIVNDHAVTMTLGSLRSQIQQVLAAGK
jgi:hypothetical protein